MTDHDSALVCGRLQGSFVNRTSNSETLPKLKECRQGVLSFACVSVLQCWC